MSDYQAPFPYFGGKSRVASTVWQTLGDVPNYVEPFVGSGAVLLGRPGWSPDSHWIETVNDKDGMVANFWRAVQQQPEEVAQWADWPCNENDLHARHLWLVGQKESLASRLEGDPCYCDPKIAGWWVWGMALWIGGGFCSGKGSWVAVDGKRVHLGNAGQGIQRRRVHLGDAGQGIKRQLVHLGNAGQGDAGTGLCGLLEWMRALAARLHRVRVCSGDWSRICGPTPTIKQGLTGVFLDPPYSAEAGRDSNIYTHDDLSVAHEVRAWCQEWQDHPLMRIVLCGYDTEHALPGWTVVRWKTKGGYANQGDGSNANGSRECLWLSPRCLPVGADATQQRGLFDAAMAQ